MNITPFDVLYVFFIFILHLAPSFAITAGHGGTGSSRDILYILFTIKSNNITLYNYYINIAKITGFIYIRTFNPTSMSEKSARKRVRGRGLRPASLGS